MQFHCRHHFDSGFELDLEFTTDHDCTVIFGPSGSGKTSILSMIAGVLLPDSGKIVLGDRVLFDSVQGICLPPEQRGVGFVFQDPLLFPHKTVLGNLEFGQRHRKRPQFSVDLDRVASVLEIEPLLTRMPDTLSGGEQQRVALGRALASGPQLLLMDEPVSSLDESLKLRVLGYLDRVIEEWKIPVLYVTHSHAEVRRIARHVLLIERGRLIAKGDVQDVFLRDEALGPAAVEARLNLLRIDKVTQEADTVYAWIGQRRLMVSPQSSPADEGNQFIQFSPADVLVSRQAVGGTSARNAIHGTIRRMVPVGHSVLLAIDVGQIMWAALTEQATRELEVEMGSEVECLIKAHSVHFV